MEKQVLTNVLTVFHFESAAGKWMVSFAGDYHNLKASVYLNNVPVHNAKPFQSYPNKKLAERLINDYIVKQK